MEVPRAVPVGLHIVPLDPALKDGACGTLAGHHPLLDWLIETTGSRWPDGLAVVGTKRGREWISFISAVAM